MSKWSPTISEAINKIKVGNYQNTKADVYRAMHEAGLTKQHIFGMLNTLNNPSSPASGIMSKLDTIAPGLTKGLRNLGNEICGGNDAPAQPNGGVASTKFPPLKKRI